MGRYTRTICAAWVLGAWLPDHALAQAASCPPPQKLLAGTCVKSCPGGYDDHGPECLYKNLSR